MGLVVILRSGDSAEKCSNGSATTDLRRLGNVRLSPDSDRIAAPHYVMRRAIWRGQLIRLHTASMRAPAWSLG